MESLGKRIIFARKRRHMTQLELAKKLGYRSKSSIARIEGNSNCMPFTKINEFATALGVTPAYIMGWEDIEGNEIIQEDTLQARATDLLVKLDPEELQQWLDYGAFLLERSKHGK